MLLLLMMLELVFRQWLVPCQSPRQDRDVPPNTVKSRTGWRNFSISTRIPISPWVLTVLSNGFCASLIPCLKCPWILNMWVVQWGTFLIRRWARVGEVWIMEIWPIILIHGLAFNDWYVRHGSCGPLAV